MKGKWSGFGLVDGRGKLNGHVASKNRSGAYVRTKVTPSNPQTSFQLAARSLLTFLSQAWRALTATQIAGWNAAAPGFAKSNVFGDKVNPTGKNLYTALNANLQTVGVAVINDAPLPEGAEQPVAGAAVITHGGAKNIAYTGTTAASKIEVWATPGVSPGVRFLKNRFRLIKTVAGSTATPIVFTTEYDAKFGDPAVGQYVGVRLVAVNATTGEKSLPTEANTFVV